jgi:hypothetical protein
MMSRFRLVRGGGRQRRQRREASREGQETLGGREVWEDAGRGEEWESEGLGWVRENIAKATRQVLLAWEPVRRRLPYFAEEAPVFFGDGATPIPGVCPGRGWRRGRGRGAKVDGGEGVLLLECVLSLECVPLLFK